MNKLATVQRCQACGATHARWMGRCTACGEWNTLQAEIQIGANGIPSRHGATSAGAQWSGPGGGAASAGSAAPLALTEVDLESQRPISTGIDELDRVLAGGFLPGSSTLLGGEPGTGKSTLLLQALGSMAALGRRCLLIAAEESAPQVRRRAVRLGAEVPGVFVLEATELPAIEQGVAQLGPDVVVVDSVQAVSDPAMGSPAGSIAQVRACAQSLVTEAKALGAALVLVGHVTKEGVLAGPRTLEHLVDTVLSFEGDRYLALRALRAVKHRFGPTGETGLFEMAESGLSGVPDPSSLFLGDRVVGAPGSAVTVPIEGHRPLLVEVQALVGRSSAVPRRFVTGLDPGRVGFLVAVLDRRAGVPVAECDVYVSVAGGARACEPAADLAVCLALASSLSGTPVAPEMVTIGEVGLGGEVRRVSGMPKRLAEAGRLGFRSALVPGAAGRRRGNERVPAPDREEGGDSRSAEREGGPRAGVPLRELPAATLGEALSAAFGDRLAPRVVRSPRSAGVCRSQPLPDRLASAGAGQVERGDDRGAGVDSAGPAVA
ncbi:MAG TPA: DNA repair protein RadA [Acidimicrobiales bacterium]|nr:DNA repair protein RadA [Acidimicrobiales bacterium]